MVEAKTAFDYKDLLNSVKELKGSLPKVAPEPFYKTLLEFVKIFDFMGSGLQMAFKGFFPFPYLLSHNLSLDITSKVGIVKRNFNNHPEGGTTSIMDFINWEADKKIQVLNGENGKLAPEPVWVGYESSKLDIETLFLTFS